MSRYIVVAFIVIALLAWAGWRVRKANEVLATALMTLAGVLALLLVGGLFGVIGG